MSSTVGRDFGWALWIKCGTMWHHRRLWLQQIPGAGTAASQKWDRQPREHGGLHRRT